MKGWGRASLLLSFGVFVAVGCGGRTGSVGDIYEPDPDPDGGTSNTGGSKPVAGRSSTGGRVGAGGSRPVPSGGVPSFGGVGSYPGTAGAPFPGGGYGGYAFGGSFPVGGYGFGGAGGYAYGGFGGFPPMDCQTCIYQSCNVELVQCFQDFGCLSIFGCMQTTGCEAFECYDPSTCGGVIDQWGGPGSPSMSMLLKAYTCAVQSGCPCN